MLDRAGHSSEFGVVGSAYLLVEFLVGVSLKREDACEHHVEQHTECPDVCRGTSVLFLDDDFGCHVAGCSAEHLHLRLIPAYPLLIFDACRKAKVDKLRRELAVE